MNAQHIQWIWSMAPKRSALDGRLVGAACTDATKQVQELLSQEGISANQQGHYGETLLHWAAMSGSEQVAAHLIEKWHADPKITDSKGDSPARVARQHGYHSLAEMLSKASNARRSAHERI